MPTRASGLSLLLLSADSDLQEQLRRSLKDATITVSRDLHSLPKSGRRAFDGVILETRRGGTELSDVQAFADSQQSFVVAGSRTVLSQAVGLMNGSGHHGNGTVPGLDDYLESKLGEFVKGMKSSAARNLHPMLISAVEKPLIALALRETNGNQIQAAHLLGMNRNTLRKKITAFRIPVKRERGRRSR